ncbi:MAG: hypothetical protein M3345_03550 [Actinomycetota bacterium]|nr:hypothetical protein [Actinomycetota bacterium]
MSKRVRDLFWGLGFLAALGGAWVGSAPAEAASPAELTFRQVLEVFGPDTPKSERPRVTGGTASGEVVVPSGQFGPTAGTLYRLGPPMFTEEDIRSAEALPDPGGAWVVSMEFTAPAARRWTRFTSRLACLRDQGDQERSQVAIVVDDAAVSVAGMRPPDPNSVNSGVECGEGITGAEVQIALSDQREAENLAASLDTGTQPDPEIPSPSPEPSPEPPAASPTATEAAAGPTGESVSIAPFLLGALIAGTIMLVIARGARRAGR